MLLTVIIPPWQFPVVIELFGWQIPIHQVTDIIAYTGGFQAYRYTKRRWPSATLTFEQQIWIIVGAIFGAIFGAKVLAWAEQPDFSWQAMFSPAAWAQGKTIVGGLLGGWCGVEMAKKCLGIKVSTGDAYVFPLIAGMAVGRVGCFLTGLLDHTYGRPSVLPWAVDFGDGIPRHPTQIYEILFLAMFAIVLWFYRTCFRITGVLFRAFMAGYLAMRFCIEFIKPREVTYGGLSPIQWVCLLATAFCLASILQLTRRNPQTTTP